ncbi:MoaD/ThiS family protein [Synechococcus sp. GFB01]|uniref:MoaD/ThiS family protein n=1 Tax=Synechococcus sp. GFB01 TaxID=1662190 RepID=UPI00350FF6C9
MRLSDTVSNAIVSPTGPLLLEPLWGASPPPPRHGRLPGASRAAVRRPARAGRLAGTAGHGGSGVTPATIWSQLQLEPPDPSATIRVAINQRFAAWDSPLAGGDELAFLPPISGG